MTLRFLIIAVLAVLLFVALWLAVAMLPVGGNLQTIVLIVVAVIVLAALAKNSGMI